MAAYKKLKKQDHYTTTYVAHKQFTITGSQHDEYGVETYLGVSGSGDWLSSTSTKQLPGTDFEHLQKDKWLVPNQVAPNATHSHKFWTWAPWSASFWRSRVADVASEAKGD